MNKGLPEAIRALKIGQYGEAESICRHVLSNEPENPHALNLLGILAGEARDHETAANLMRLSVEMAPQVPEYRKNLVRALIQINQFDEAASVMRSLLNSANDSADNLAMMGMILGSKGDLDDGIKYLRKAIHVMPNAPEFHFNIAELYRRNGQFDAARSSLIRSLQLQPNNTDAWNNLAGLQMAAGMFLDALNSIKRLLELNPRSVQGYCNLGSLLGAAGDSAGAATSFRNALRLQPQSTRAKYHLINMLIREGELTEAEAIAHQLEDDAEMDPVVLKTTQARILERKGKVEEAWSVMSSISPKDLGNPDVATMMAILQEQRGDKSGAITTLNRALNENEVAAIDGIGIYFTLGQLYDSLNQFDEAFHAYQIGNENRKKTFEIFEGLTKDLSTGLEKVRELYSPGVYANCPKSGIDSDVPIFIVGMPRSGTTLLEQIVSGHPSVFGAGELTKFQDLIRESYSTQPQQSSPFSLTIEDPSQGNKCLVPANWNSISASHLAQLGDKYLEYVFGLTDRESKRITDKLPYNYFVVGLIAKVFPNAQILHCVRNPLDTCLSCYFQNFTAGSQYSYDLTELGKYYREYQAIMDHWRMLGIPMLDVNYEDLVHDPQPIVRDVLNHCRLDWDDSCLNFHRSKRVVSTASYQQVRQPLYTRSAGRWTHYVKHLRPLIEALGLDYEEHVSKAAETHT